MRAISIRDVSLADVGKAKELTEADKEAVRTAWHAIRGEGLVPSGDVGFLAQGVLDGHKWTIMSIAFWRRLKSSLFGYTWCGGKWPAAHALAREVCLLLTGSDHEIGNAAREIAARDL